MSYSDDLSSLLSSSSPISEHINFEEEEIAENNKSQEINNLNESIDSGIFNVNITLNKHDFLCPITMELFRDPVIAQDGITYERVAIEEWFSKSKTSPITREKISIKLYPNIFLRNQINKLISENPNLKSKQYETTDITMPSIKRIYKTKSYGRILNYKNYNIEELIEKNKKTVTKKKFGFIKKNVEICETCVLKQLLRNCKDERILNYFLDNAINLGAKNSNHNKLIHFLCEFSPVNIVVMAVNKGADLKSKTKKGLYPIHFACKGSNLEVVKYLIENGVDLEAEANNGWKPIHYACRHGSYSLIKYVINSGVTVDYINNRIARFVKRNKLHLNKLLNKNSNLNQVQKNDIINYIVETSKVFNHSQTI